MTPAPESPPPLAPEDAARLLDFARACKAAARAVVLYPSGHPAITATLGRLAHITSAAALPGPLSIEVRPDGLLIDGRAPARPDAALGELATLLHDHLIGTLTVHPGGDAEAWHRFLSLVGRPVESVRAEGGIARAWTMLAQRHIELREIDYAEVLRERTGGRSATWDRVVANCLQGQALDLDDETARVLVEVAAHADRLGDLVSALEARSTEGGSGLSTKATALLRMLRGILDAVGKAQPDRVEPVLRNMATALGRLSADGMVALLTQDSSSADAETAPVLGAVLGRMSDGTIAHFVAQNLITEGTPTDRLAQAFQALVPDHDHQGRLLALARADVANSPVGQGSDFETLWTQATEKLLQSYTDRSYVSETYGKELSGARSHAVEIERVSDDPPERIAAWLGTVATSAVRTLDLALLLDLMRIEQDASRWRDLVGTVVSEIEDLALIGDFDAAHDLIAVLVAEATSDGPSGRHSSAARAVERLVTGSMMRHLVVHLATIDETQFARVKELCLALGEGLVQPLAEALTGEEAARTRDRLTSILIAFGPTGRRTVERLKSSPNAAVRRTAIYLLREFGGTEALPDLTELLNDREPQVQREAVRAILNIGNDRAYRVLEQALTTGSEQSRESILQAFSGVRDERAAPLFAHILVHVDHRGPLRTIYLRAIEGLGALRDPEGIPALKDALYRGEWWAPRRTAELRSAAAAALARVGTREALDVLQQAATTGARGVRAAARPHAIRATKRP